MRALPSAGLSAALARLPSLSSPPSATKGSPVLGSPMGVPGKRARRAAHLPGEQARGCTARKGVIRYTLLLLFAVLTPFHWKIPLGCSREDSGAFAAVPHGVFACWRLGLAHKAEGKQVTAKIFAALPGTTTNVLAAPDLAHVRARVFVQWPWGLHLAGGAGQRALRSPQRSSQQPHRPGRLPRSGPGIFAGSGYPARSAPVQQVLPSLCKPLAPAHKHGSSTSSHASS